MNRPTSASEVAKAAEEIWPGVRVDILGSTRWELSAIVVPKHLRNQGVGTAIMEFITEAADHSGVTVVLSPSTDYGASSVDRLRRFYRRFGFVRNTGRTADYTLSGGMYRYPKQKNPRIKSGEVVIEYHQAPKDDYDVFPRSVTKAVVLESIHVPRSSRGHGVAREALREFMTKMTSECTAIILDPYPFELDRLLSAAEEEAATRRLVKLYKSVGFEEGRSGLMYYIPETCR